MNEQRRRYLTELLARSREHDRGKANRLERYRNLEPARAHLDALNLEADLLVLDAARTLSNSSDAVTSPEVSSTVIPVGAGLRLAVL